MQSRPIKNLSASKLRDGKDSRRASTGTLQNGRVIKPNQRTAIFWTMNVTEVVDCNGERRAAGQGRVVSRRKKQVVATQGAKRACKTQGIQGRSRMACQRNRAITLIGQYVPGKATDSVVSDPSLIRINHGMRFHRAGAVRFIAIGVLPMPRRSAPAAKKSASSRGAHG